MVGKARELAMPEVIGDDQQRGKGVRGGAALAQKYFAATIPALKY